MKNVIDINRKRLLSDNNVTSNDVVVDDDGQGTILFTVPCEIPESKALILQAILGYRAVFFGFYNYKSEDGKTTWSAYGSNSLKGDINPVEWKE